MYMCVTHEVKQQRRAEKCKAKATFGEVYSEWEPQLPDPASASRVPSEGEGVSRFCGIRGKGISIIGARVFECRQVALF